MLPGPAPPPSRLIPGVITPAVTILVEIRLVVVVLVVIVYVLDTLRHSIAKVTMNSNNKYKLILLSAIVAMAFFASCQEQGSTTTRTQPTATATTSTQHRTTQGVVQRTRPATPSPTP
jgi:hypothetical protein